MVMIKELGSRVRSWPASALPPDDMLDYVWPLDDNHFAYAGTGTSVLSDEIDEKRMSFPAIITAVGTDRLGDQVVPEGGVFEGYSGNPVVFFGHQLLPFPIGRAVDDVGELQIAVEPGQFIKSRCFCYQGQSKWAEQVLDIFQLILDKILNGVSIGFDPDPDRRFTKRLPTGGHRFERWHLLEWSVVGVGCQKDALTIHGKNRLKEWTDEQKRSGEMVSRYLSRGRIAGKRIDPLVRKAIMPLAMPQVKTLFVPPPTKTRTEGAAVKKKSVPHLPFSRAALKRMQAVRRKKDMTSSNGTQGGYTVPSDDEVAKALRDVMEGMEDNSGHGLYYSKDDGYVHHSHPPDYSPAKLGEMRTACIGVKGVSEVYQSADSGPQGDGWEKVFPVEQEAMTADEMECKCGGCPGCHAKSLPLYAVLKKHMPPKVLKDLQACVSHKISKIAEDNPDMPADQRVAVAFSMCGEKSKDMQADGDEDEYDDYPKGTVDDLTQKGSDDAVNAADSQEAEGEPTPMGIRCLQALIEHLQEKLPELEPGTKVKEFYERILEEAEDVAAEDYPEYQVGGGDEEGAEHLGVEETSGAADNEADQSAEDEEETEEVLSQYRVAPVPVVKALRRIRPHHTDAIKAAADHLHTVAGLGDDEMTQEHRAACHEHARALDALHGAVGGVDTSMTREDEDAEVNPPKPAGEVEKAETVQDGEETPETGTGSEAEEADEDTGGSQESDEDEEEEEDEEQPQKVEKALDYTAVAAALERLEKTQDENKRMLFKATGVRV